MSEKREIQMMMVQLLFKNKPQTPSTDTLRSALEKYLGDLGNVPYAEPSQDMNNGVMFMFPLEKYKVVLKDAPDGMPVMASFLASNEQPCIKIDDFTRSQLWDVPNGNEIINECKYSVLISTILGAALPYRNQAEVLLAQIAAALDCYTDCIGIYSVQSGKLITPEMFADFKGLSLSERFIKLFVNARFFRIPDTDEMIVDTLGFYAFGGADVQVHFKGMDPNNVVRYVYNLASYQFDNDFVIENGETVDGLDKNGDIDMSLQWKVQYEKSLVKPERTVLDINCGEYAGGKRK